MTTKPWSKPELEEIAQLRKIGWENSRITGWMKTASHRKGHCPALPKEGGKMATKKAGKKAASKKVSKKASKKAASKKVSKKAAGKKAAGKAGRKTGGFQCGDTLTAVQGMEDSFYKQFPRFKAYQLICKKKKMKTTAFVDAVEKLEGVKSRGQALGILTKLLDKGCVTASGEKKAA